jgi:hypothetical protein
VAQFIGGFADIPEPILAVNSARVVISAGIACEKRGL